MKHGIHNRPLAYCYLYSTLHEYFQIAMQCVLHLKRHCSCEIILYIYGVHLMKQLCEETSLTPLAVEKVDLTVNVLMDTVRKYSKPISYRYCWMMLMQNVGRQSGEQKKSRIEISESIIYTSHTRWQDN